MNIIGDGINVAQRVMSFSRPGQLLVSRSFYEVVSCLSRDYMNLFRHEGSRTDKHVREHEVYSVAAAPAARRVAEVESAMNRGNLARWLGGTGPFGLRRSSLVAAPALFAGLVGTGLAVSAFSGGEGTESAVAVVAAPPKAQARLVNASDLLRPADTPALKKAAVERKPAPEKRPVPERRVEKVVAAKAAPAPAPAAPVAAEGKVVVAVAPWGEVLVNGRSRGVSPPLQSIDLPAGTHTIEIRNGAFPAHVREIVVKPGEPVRIRHRFQ
jgi:hypothetical protein